MSLTDIFAALPKVDATGVLAENRSPPADTRGTDMKAIVLRRSKLTTKKDTNIYYTTLAMLGDGKASWFPARGGEKYDVLFNTEESYTLHAGWTLSIKEMRGATRMSIGTVVQLNGVQRTISQKDDDVFFGFSAGKVSILDESPSAAMALLPYEVRRVENVSAHPTHDVETRAFMGEKYVEDKYPPHRLISFYFNRGSTVAPDTTKSFVVAQVPQSELTVFSTRAKGSLLPTDPKEMCIRAGTVDPVSGEPVSSDIYAEILQSEGGDSAIERIFVLFTVYKESLGCFGIDDLQKWIQFGKTFYNGLAATFVGTASAEKTEKQESVPDGVSFIIGAYGTLAVDMPTTVRNVGYPVSREVALEHLDNIGTYKTKISKFTNSAGWKAFNGVGKEKELHVPAGAQSGQRCVNMSLLDGYMVGCDDAEYWMVYPHAFSREKMESITSLDEYRAGFDVTEDCMCFVITPKAVSSYIVDKAPYAPAAAKKARVD